MEFTLNFFQLLIYVLYLFSPIILFLLFIIILLGQIVGKKENWDWIDSLYWSFITSTTVGYGDIKPTGKLSKILAVFIAFIGLIFTGIIVAAAILAAREVIHAQPDIKTILETIDTIAK